MKSSGGGGGETSKARGSGDLGKGGRASMVVRIIGIVCRSMVTNLRKERRRWSEQELDGVAEVKQALRRLQR
ncbi:unnamed protein product [Cochlearia groenlandica]